MTTATVQQGQNFDNIQYGTQQNPSVMEADIRFNNSCIYNHQSRNQYDWNKLIGFFDGYSPVSRSVRWGWRWSVDNGSIEVAPYVHHNDQILLPSADQWVLSVPLNEWIRIKIRLERCNNRYVFRYEQNGNVIEKTVGVGNLNGTYAGVCLTDLLYFGGTKPAPHQITIDYQNIKTTSCQKVRLYGASQTWSVTYKDLDGNPAASDGGPSDDFSICAEAGSLAISFGDVHWQIMGNW